MIGYMTRHPDTLLELTLEHLELSLASVAIAFVIAYGVAMLMYRFRFLSVPVNGICNAIFAIPSLAMFAILIPITGLGETTAVITLVLYNQFILTKSISNAFLSIPANVVEAATGLGLSKRSIYWGVKVPMALPGIVSGLKMSIVSTITMATLAATVGAGGLGVLLFNGMTMKQWSQVLWGVLLSSVLALIASSLTHRLEAFTLARSRGEGKRKPYL